MSLDFSTLVDGINLATVSTAIMAVGAIMIGPNVAAWAVRKIVSFFR
jgi:hypothetical protein